MPRPAQQLADAYFVRLKSLESTRQKIERLYVAKHIAKRDVEQVYGGLFASAYTAFEGSLEDLFFGLLMGRLVSSYRDVRSKIKVDSESVAREVVLAGADFIEWLPYNKTEKRAKIFFASGKPFTSLEDGEKSVLKQCSIIRNAIAHNSRYANNLFQVKVIGGMVLAPRERAPIPFLRSQFRTNPAQCRYENYAATLLRIANKLCQ